MTSNSNRSTTSHINRKRHVTSVATKRTCDYPILQNDQILEQNAIQLSLNKIPVLSLAPVEKCRVDRFKITSGQQDD
jgi:hypothetical protein